MKDKKNLDFLVLPIWLTDKLHLFSGPWRDIFSTIYNYSKDGKHTYRSPMDELAKVGHISERHAITIVNTLVASGYISREQKKVISKGESAHAKYEYKANISELLDRLEAGEDVWPVSPKKGEISSPIIEGEKGEETSAKGVKKVTKKGEKSSPQYKDSIRNSKEYLSTREAQEREFFKIFFMRNAADPVAEVMRFVGWYQSKDWTDSRGRKYETTEQRAGLAWPWDIKTGTGRLPECVATENFFSFLGDIYAAAAEIGGINPKQILDPRSDYILDERYGFIWRCTEAVQQWCEGHVDILRPIKEKYIGKETRLYFDRYAA